MIDVQKFVWSRLQVRLYIFQPKYCLHAFEMNTYTVLHAFIIKNLEIRI